MRLSSRLVVGAVAGFVGTMAMTGAMRKLHARLPGKERYPLTPREIIDSAGVGEDEAARDLTLVAHFLYGAACGALLAAASERPGKASGAAAGAAIWVASYMGWIPAVSLLKPATDHPARRNALMIGAHLVWGSATATAICELVDARETIFAAGPDRDAPLSRRASVAPVVNPPSG
ncbi:hypothetical protein [Sphingosinicella terrae]|uniref:hypothetical protein n=1 Tax=Sphingosinicella terrae TaxID=2172047 RepID=UPI000E0D29C2|nr:hypothetical protein [Sphingosinicella terrae]